MKPLREKIAVVAGATRGAGRGIACMLGEAGAIVYCTGRSIRKRSKTRRRNTGSPCELKSRPETIEETAEMVTARGGVGIHAQVDHTVEEQVEALFKRVKKEQGRLDILVNDIWGGDELTEWGKPFWKLDPQYGRIMLDHFDVTEENWRDAIKKEPSFAESETPFFVGRAVAALAADPNVREKSGKALSSWNLAKEYGFTDIDGRQPDMGGRIAKDWGDRWDKIVSAVQDEFRKHEQNPDRDFEYDQLRLELRARLNPGSGSPKWYTWPVMGHELWMRDAKTMAAGFYKQYREALERRQSAID